MKKLVAITLLLLIAAVSLSRAQNKSGNFELRSPDGSIIVHVSTGVETRWSVDHKGQALIAPSAIALYLEEGAGAGGSGVAGAGGGEVAGGKKGGTGGGGVPGHNVSVSSVRQLSVDSSFAPINYKKDKIRNQYNQLTINCKGDYSIIFRAYNDAVAYRFVTRRKGELIVKNEEANFNFVSAGRSFIPIQWDYRMGKTFNSSFEALYHEIGLSAFPKDSLAFLPVLIGAGENKKVAILEADLEDYPGMYLDGAGSNQGLKGVYAPYPLEAELHSINYIPTKRADYIARTTGTRSFPWRAIVISEQDKDLLNQDIVQKLASPPRFSDVSWIKPGLVAWDWWNNWNITHVDFKTGINTETYKYYIDFAAENHLQYIVMDEGWSNDHDLLKIVPAINLQQIIDYGKQKGIGVILWATWHTIDQQMDTVFPHYSAMGIKGFKIDFFDRDDQLVVASTYAIAKKAAQYKLMVDYHGIYKPTGLQRTYPNVVGFEGVKGLENFKWADEDQPRYVVTIPFIRMMAGPMDYTPGAMRNATERTYRPVNNNPMAKGTRCQQLAEYVIFEAPVQMLADNPTTYRKEQECTNFITTIPTTFDETVALDGKVGEYVALARRKGDSWFAAAMTNWTARQLTIDCSFLPEGNYEAEIFTDGINADRDATDYKKEIIKVRRGDKIAVSLSKGGGWAARIYPAR